MDKKYDVEFDIHLTNRCVCYCSHCFMDSAHTKVNEMSLEQLSKVFDNVIEMGGKEVHLTGGEVFLREDLEEIVSTARNKGLMVKLNTCGVGVSSIRLEKMRDLGIKWLGVGIEGATAETCAKIKNRKDAFECAVKTIRNAIELGIKVEAQILITNENIHEMVQLTELLHDLNVTKMSVFYYSPVNRGYINKHLQPSVEEWRDTISKMQERLCSLGSTLKICKDEPNVESTDYQSDFCRIKLRNLCMIMPNGVIYPCPLLVWTDYYVGNVLENDIKTLWYNDKYWEKFIPHNIKVNGCNNTKCSGGCIAYKNIYLNTIDGCDPRCTYKVDKMVPRCVVHTDFLLRYKR